jgi:hypothetical protein
MEPRDAHSLGRGGRPDCAHSGKPGRFKRVRLLLSCASEAKPFAKLALRACLCSISGRTLGSQFSTALLDPSLSEALFHIGGNGRTLFGTTRLLREKATARATEHRNTKGERKGFDHVKNGSKGDKGPQRPRGKLYSLCTVPKVSFLSAHERRASATLTSPSVEATTANRGRAGA